VYTIVSDGHSIGVDSENDDVASQTTLSFLAVETAEEVPML
jgi:hypothetical protein